MPTASDERWIRVGESRVRVIMTGQGPYLLLLNGIGAHVGMWEPLVARLRDTRRCILLDMPGTKVINYEPADMPGTGASPPLRRPMRMASLANVVADVLDGLELHCVDILGYSWGGALAQQFARDHRARVRTLCLVSTVPGVGGKPPPLRVAVAMLSPIRFSARDRTREVAPLVYGGEYRRDEPLGESALKRWSECPPSKSGYAHQLYAITGWSSLMWLRQIRARTLIIAGDDDPLVPVHNVRLMRRLMPDATVHLEPGGGHLWLLDHADESAAVIEGFLSATRPPSSAGE